MIEKLHIISESTVFIAGLNNNPDILALLEPEGFTSDILTNG